MLHRANGWMYLPSTMMTAVGAEFPDYLLMQKRFLGTQQLQVQPTYTAVLVGGRG